jgi:hypothetical protein
MDSRDEELIFDFMAAAEDTGKRLDSLIKAFPGTLQKTLSDEYQRSPWLATLPKEVERLSAVVQRADSAAERTESATAHTERRIKTVCLVCCFSAIIMPLAVWGLAYWQTGNLRDEQAVVRAETKRLQTYAAKLTDKTGGGVGVWTMTNGEYIVALPKDVEPSWSGKNDDGLYLFRYTWPPVRK